MKRLLVLWANAISRLPISEDAKFVVFIVSIGMPLAWLAGVLVS